MTGRCGNCKWWRQDVSERDSKWGVCVLAEASYGWDGVQYDHPESKARAEADAYEKEGASLATRYDFGCVQHEPGDDA